VRFSCSSLSQDAEPAPEIVVCQRSRIAVAEPRFQVRLVRRRTLPVPALRVAGPVPEVRPTGWDDAMVWRLLGTNNRELGRSADQFDTVDACLRGIDAARALIGDTAQPRIYFNTDEGAGYSWWWTVEQAGASVITAARTFSRQRDCLTNFDQFKASALVAAVTDATPQRRPGRAVAASRAPSTGHPRGKTVRVNARGVVQ
jgi:hypothetical protein